jgi:hypothetical protein
VGLNRYIPRAAVAILSATFALGQAQVNPVAALSEKIQEGKVELKFDDAQGYLRSLLEALNIPIESQMAVFSKTSIQALRIEPRSPRTLFFNDSVIVGWVRGGFIEVAAQDPQQGMMFYTVDERPWVHQQRIAKPETRAEPFFNRRQDCLNCHVSPATFGIPGTLVRSVFPGPDGVPLHETAEYDTDQRTPFDKLWGGWYVTGSSGASRHIGNAVVTDPAKPESMVSSVAGNPESLNPESLKDKFDTGAYLSPYSDIVALMVFEHQTHMMNLISRMNKLIKLSELSDDAAANELVDYMLFIDEPPLENKIAGTSGFSEKFAATGPRDSKGRSLRQLDLEHRLMRYPCSYMIYTAAFDGMPAGAKDTVYRRLWQILSGKDNSGRYSRLSPDDRRAIVEILRDTKNDLPDYFK